MHENGIHVSLDDFGVGYSSLALFKNLSLDTVKLDRSFFTNSDQSDASRLVLCSVAEMLKRLEKITVSECVETADQLDVVRAFGGDLIQGFYFDRPLPRDAFTARLQNRHYDKPLPVPPELPM